MRGTQGNIGLIPQEVADKLSGRSFNNFNEFRSAFWKEIANSSYVLHHKTPIHAGGGVYDLNNLVIVTPRMHQEILDKVYHFGN